MGKASSHSARASTFALSTARPHLRACSSWSNAGKGPANVDSTAWSHTGDAKGFEARGLSLRGAGRLSWRYVARANLDREGK
jgi:hypothetical protein